MTTGRFFMVENPQTSKMWNQRHLLTVSLSAGVSWGTCDMCPDGMQDPVTGIPYKKSVSLLHHFEPSNICYLFRRCNRTREQRRPVEGMCPGHGSRTALTQVHPLQFCTTLARCVASAFWPHRDTLVNDATQTTFMEDLLAHLPDKELPQVDQFLQHH